MLNYDFKSLSSLDFEELSQSLLQANMHIRLERFKSGADRGIDLRFAKTSGKEIIVQCKHYAESGYKALIRSLKSEIKKVRALKPSRYLIVTSVRLSAANKDEIHDLMHPFVLNVSDIFGKEDLNNLLSLHPNIEKKNFKLWLTSVNVLQAVLHNVEHFQSRFEVERIRGKLRLFVENTALARAQKILYKNNIVIISGPPGIGKTTLAEMIIFDHLHKGYEPVVIKSDVNEGKRVYDPTHKQIFYFDDFLGQTFLNDKSGMIQNNQDAVLTDFIAVIKRSRTARFILTTREHILSNAILSSERLKRSDLNAQKCILTLGDYTLYQKARILFNHFYFSDMPVSYKSAILKEEYYLKAIKHSNFTPRIIEWVSSFSRIRHVEADDYMTFFQRVLDNPEEIWQHAFSKQISEAARGALLCLTTLGGDSQYGSLAEKWTSFYRYCSRKYNFAIKPDEFRDAIQELEGAFIRIGNYNSISFINPSVKDFMNSVICMSSERAVDLLSSATKLDQISGIWQIIRRESGRAVRQDIKPLLPKMLPVFERLSKNPVFVQHESGKYNTQFDICYEDRCTLYLEIMEALETNELSSILEFTISEMIESWEKGFPEFESTIGLLSKLDDLPQFSEIYQEVKNAAIPEFRYSSSSYFEALHDYSGFAFSWSPADTALLTEAFSNYIEDRLDQERSECTDSGELETLSDKLVDIGKKLNVSTQSVVRKIQSEMLDKLSEERERDVRHHTSVSKSSQPAIDEIEPIRNMFGGLIV